MSIKIKIIDQQGSEETTIIYTGEKFHLYPGDQAYLDPEITYNSSIIKTGDNLLILSFFENSITIDNFFHDENLDIDSNMIKIVWVNDVPITSADSIFWQPYLIDMNEFASRQLSLATEQLAHQSQTEENLIIPYTVTYLASNDATELTLDSTDSSLTIALNEEYDFKYPGVANIQDGDYRYGPIPVGFNTSLQGNVQRATSETTVTTSNSDSQSRSSNNNESFDQIAFAGLNTTTAIPANNDPVLTLPSNQTVNEDDSVNFAGASVSDVDANGADISLSLSVTNGIINLDAPALVSFINGTNDGESTLNGTNNTDWIDGRRGNDIINGNAGDDLLFGDRNNDTMSGGTGDDYLDGGRGNDTLNGDDGNDILFGDRNTDTLNGGTGDDYLDGGNGNDTLNGDDGNDSLFGDRRDDTLDGGDGNDLLNGGKDDDTLTGGSGNDIFQFTSDHVIGADFDSITDFNPVEDTLDISDLLTGFVDGVSDINEYLIIDSSGNIDVDNDGAAGGPSYVQIADMAPPPAIGTSIQVIADMLTITVDVVA